MENIQAVDTFKENIISELETLEKDVDGTEHLKNPISEKVSTLPHISPNRSTMDDISNSLDLIAKDLTFIRLSFKANSPPCPPLSVQSFS